MPTQGEFREANETGESCPKRDLFEAMLVAPWSATRLGVLDVSPWSMDQSAQACRNRVTSSMGVTVRSGLSCGGSG